MGKVMLSSPMAGKTDKEIVDERLAMINEIETIYSHYEIMDTVIEDHESKTDLECFAESAKFLSQADVLFMGKGWADARGCKFEHDIASAYGLQIMYL